MSAFLKAELANARKRIEMESTGDQMREEKNLEAISTAAGPWIRVDSGERPEDGERVMLAWLTYGSEENIVCATYQAAIDCVRDDGADGGMMSMFDWFARIRPPEER